MNEKELAELLKSQELARQIVVLVKELRKRKLDPDAIGAILDAVFPNAPGGPVGIHTPILIGSP